MSLKERLKRHEHISICNQAPGRRIEMPDQSAPERKMIWARKHKFRRLNISSSTLSPLSLSFQSETPTDVRACVHRTPKKDLKQEIFFCLYLLLRIAALAYNVSKSRETDKAKESCHFLPFPIDPWMDGDRDYWLFCSSLSLCNDISLQSNSVQIKRFDSHSSLLPFRFCSRSPPSDL